MIMGWMKMIKNANGQIIDLKEIIDFWLKILLILLNGMTQYFRNQIALPVKHVALLMQRNL